MNFLAHLYLSGDNDNIKIGNFVADWIKGSDYKRFPFDIQRGILIHRYIDSFTDNHPIVKKSKNRFAGKYHKYSGIIVDICYDHFLSLNWDKYCTTPLHDYTQHARKTLLANKFYFIEDIQDFLVRFLKKNWLESYIEIEGIEQVLVNMSRFTSLPDKTADAMRILRDEHVDFGNEFNDFFAQLVDYVEDEFNIDIKQQMRYLH